MNTHRQHRYGGNDESQSCETSTQTSPQQSPSLYGKVTYDFDQKLGLRLVTATSAQQAESLLSWNELVSQHYGAVEITPQLLRHLKEIIENGELMGVVSISFDQNPEGGFGLGEVESAPGPADGRKKAVPARKRGRELHLFGCLTKSHLFGQFRLIFVRARDAEHAMAQFVAEGCGNEDMFVVKIGPNLLSVLIQSLTIHESHSDGITECWLPKGTNLHRDS